MMRAIVTFLLFVLVQVIGSAVALLFGNLDRIGQGVPLRELPVSAESSGVALLVFEVLLCMGLQWYFSYADRTTGHTSAHLRPMSWSSRGLALVGTLGFSLSLSLLLTPLHLDDSGTLLLFEGMKHNALCLLLLCLIGPLTEEMVFRKGVFRGLLGQHLNPIVAVALSALAFALVHANLAQGIPAFLIGLVFGFCYLRTGSIALSFPIHVANNVLAVLLMFFPQVEQAVGQWSPLCTVMAGLVLAAASMMGIYKSLTA